MSENLLRNSSRLPSLDGWRALSIIAVLGSHSTLVPGFPPDWIPLCQWIFDGGLGVRMFFVISGFLITWLLLAEHDRAGRINLGHFYARRGLRILPVYGACLLVLGLLQACTAYRQSAGAWLANFTFTTNFIRSGNWTSGHLWSLAVEEQFYLLWPCLFAALAGSGKIRGCFWTLAVPLCVAPAARIISYQKTTAMPLGFLFTPHSFFNFFDSLAIGCLAAVLLAWKPDTVAAWSTRRPWVVLGTGLLLIIVPHLLTSLFLLGIFTVPFGPTCQGLGFALLLLQSVRSPGFGPYPMLNLRAVCLLGALSYSLYIWQQFFCTTPATFGVGPVWWLSFPGWLLAALLAAALSYFGLERPLLRLRAKFRQ